VLAILFALPLQKTAGSSGFLARFALADIFTALAIAGTVVALARGNAGDWRSIRVPGQFLIGVALFLPAVAVSFFVTETVERSIVETIAYLVNLVIVSVIVFHIRTREDLYRCLRTWEIAVWIVVLGAFVGVIFLFQGRLDTLLTNGPKVTSTFKKSGQLSAYIMASLPVLWFTLIYRSKTRRQRILRGLFLALAVVSLFATGSRTGFLLGAGLTGVLFGGRWLTMLLRRRTVLKLSSLAFAAILAVPIFAIVLQELPFSFQRAFSIASSGGLSSLEDLSQTRHYQIVGFQVAANKYPLTGVGVGDFYTRNTALAPGAWKHHEIHNTYLGVWAETGIVGILALFLFYLAIVQAVWQTISHARDPELVAIGIALLISLTTLCLYGLSHFGLRMRHMWAVFGLILAAWNVLWRERRLREQPKESS
jgi:O-antigen ligase